MYKASLKHAEWCACLQGDAFLFTSSVLEYMNLIAAAIIIVLTVTVVSHFTYRRIMCRTRNMRW